MYGLSPLARGTLFCLPPSALRLRFIPAGAGNTHPEISAHLLHPVYPRWRGEHLTSLPSVHPFIGLSPLARGTRCIGCVVVLFYRFIPAGAGNTNPTILKSPPVPVYPRWRGEHVCTKSLANDGGGLSPLARGTHLRQLVRMLIHRFIPAGAGNTLSQTLRGSL